MSLKLAGKLEKFDLSGGVSGHSRNYFVCNMNFLAVQKYTDSETYDHESGLGSQREANERHVEYLKNEIINLRYTPDTFKFSVSENTVINEKDGIVEVVVDENNKLKIMDGGHRKAALHKLWTENAELRRTVENLPVPCLININGDSKKDFINYQKGRQINKSQLLSMQIDIGDVKADQKDQLIRGRDLVKLSNTDERSPFFRMVRFSEGSVAPLALTSLLTTRKSDLLGSFYFSARLVELIEKSNEWFQTILDEVYEYIKRETECANTGNLLCPPPNSARGCANLLLSVVNTFCYYLYLHNRSKPLSKDYKTLNRALAIYNEAVDGDLSGLRRQKLARGFTEILFEDVANDDESTVAFHAGIPIPLIVMTSNSCFGVDSPGKVLLTHAEREDDRTIEALVSPIYQIKMDSDTSEGWFEK